MLSEIGIMESRSNKVIIMSATALGLYFLLRESSAFPFPEPDDGRAEIYGITLS